MKEASGPGKELLNEYAVQVHSEERGGFVKMSSNNLMWLIKIMWIWSRREK